MRIDEPNSFLEERRVEIERVFKENYRELCFLANRYLEDKKVSEDIVQDVFVQILSKDKDAPILNLKGYTRVAVKNASLNYLRNKKRLEISNEPIGIAHLSNDNGDEEFLRERETKIFDAVELLPDKRKKIFLQCVVEGYTYQKVADDMGISVNTVKVQMQKAFKKLRATLKDTYFIALFFDF